MRGRGAKRRSCRTAQLAVTIKVELKTWRCNLSNSQCEKMSRVRNSSLNLYQISFQEVIRSYKKGVLAWSGYKTEHYVLMKKTAEPFAPPSRSHYSSSPTTLSRHRYFHAVFSALYCKVA